MQVDPSAALMALAGGLVGAGLGVLVVPFRLRRPGPPARRVLPSRVVVVRAAAGIVLGTVVGWVTGWPAAGLAAAAAVSLLPGLFSGPSQADVVAKLEAIAVWTEQLRDTMMVSKGLAEALQVTARVNSGPLEGPLGRMSVAVKMGVRPADALRTLATELADPTADMVIAPLVMSAERDASQISGALDALAKEARREASQRREVDASRASARSEMRTVAIGSVAFMGAFWLVGRSTPLLTWYSTMAGQLVLGLVFILMATGIWLMARLVRPRGAERIALMEAER